MLMNAQPVLLRPETLTLRDRPVRVVPPEEVIDSEALLKGRREILIQHGDRAGRVGDPSAPALSPSVYRSCLSGVAVAGGSPA